MPVPAAFVMKTRATLSREPGVSSGSTRTPALSRGSASRSPPRGKPKPAVATATQFVRLRSKLTVELARRAAGASHDLHACGAAAVDHVQRCGVGLVRTYANSGSRQDRVALYSASRSPGARTWTATSGACSATSSVNRRVGIAGSLRHRRRPRKRPPVDRDRDARPDQRRGAGGALGVQVAWPDPRAPAPHGQHRDVEPLRLVPHRVEDVRVAEERHARADHIADGRGRRWVGRRRPSWSAGIARTSMLPTRTLVPASTSMS